MNEMFADGDVLKFSRGEEIPTDGHMFFIESGTVGIYSIDDHSKRWILGLIAGDTFPHTRSSTIFTSRIYTFIANQKTVVRSITTEQFMTRATQPAFAKAVIDNLTHLNQWELERLDNLQHSQVIIRLLERLCFFAVRFGKVSGDKVVINVPISHVDFASSIGTTRETVNRFMRQLEDLGLVSVKRQYITIYSLDKLMKITLSQKLPKHRINSLI